VVVAAAVLEDSLAAAEVSVVAEAAAVGSLVILLNLPG